MIQKTCNGFIVYNEGSKLYFPTKIEFPSLKIVLVLTNSVDLVGVFTDCQSTCLLVSSI